MRWSCALLILTLAACGDGNSGSGSQAPAEKKAGTAPQARPGTAPEDMHTILCALFTPEDLKAYTGEQLQAPREALGGMGCQWMEAMNAGFVLITAMSKEFQNLKKDGKAYRPLPDIGPDAGVMEDAGRGWRAETIMGNDILAVSLDGKTASADQAAALLREVLKRLKK